MNAFVTDDHDMNCVDAKRGIWTQKDHDSESNIKWIPSVAVLYIRSHDDTAEIQIVAVSLLVCSTLKIRSQQRQSKIT